MDETMREAVAVLAALKLCDICSKFQSEIIEIEDDLSKESVEVLREFLVSTADDLVDPS